jgi:alanyl-tRNA synthetase
MSWEKLEPHTNPRGKMPADVVSITSNKHMTLTSIYNQLGESVELLYDADTNRMALRPSQSSDAFSIKKQKSSNSWRVCLVRFINYYGLETCVGKHYQVTRENGLFVIDLNSPIGPTRSHRYTPKTN